MNPHLVALTIAFERPDDTGPDGHYRAAERFPVRVETDGQTVTLTFPDGLSMPAAGQLFCDHEPLSAVMRPPA